MVYLFGDLRQLRKFEMSRPIISMPQNLIAHTVVSNSAPTPAFHDGVNLHAVALPKSPSPAFLRAPSRPVSSASSRYLSSDTSCTSRPVSSVSSQSLEISPAYYDKDLESGDFPVQMPSGNSDYFPPTAPFIQSYDSLCDPEYFGEILAANSRVGIPRNPVSLFNFDLLPRRLQPPCDGGEGSPMQERNPLPSFVTTAKGGIGRLQDLCLDASLEKAAPVSECKVRPRPRPSADAAARCKAQFKVIRSVPAFGSPFTRVLSPIVTRAQWEIVVRSSALSLLISWVCLFLLSVITRRG